MRLRISLLVASCLLLALPAAAQTLSATPVVVTFQYQSPAPVPQPVEVEVAASVGALPSLAAVLTPGPNTPAGLFPVTVMNEDVVVAVDRGVLGSILSQPGIYSATVTVTAAGFPSLTIPVSLDLGGNLSIQAAPSSLVFNILAGVSEQVVNVTATGGAAVSFSAVAATTTGGNWLTVSSNEAFTPAVLTVTAHPGTLPPGTYAGSLTVTPSNGSPVTVPVTLQAGTSSLTLSPAALTFNYELGTAPLPQVIHASSTIANNTYTAQAGSTGSWLLVNGAKRPVSGALPTDLTVTINPNGLTAGAPYQGTVTVIAGDGSTINVPVTLVITGMSAIANPTSLEFVSEAGGPPPSPQTVVISGVTNSAYTAAVTSGGSWFSISNVVGKAPDQVTVAATPGALPVGTYTGNIGVTVGGKLQNIQVTLLVVKGPVLTAHPGALVLNYLGGNTAPPPVNLDVSAGSGPSQSFAISSGLPAWLTAASPGSNMQTPSNLLVTANVTGLSSGTYLTDIVLVPSATGATPILVPVILTISGANGIVAGAQTLTFGAAPGGAPQSQTVQLTASLPTAFTTGATTAEGGNWLTVSPASGTAGTVNTPMTVTADATHLAAGTYQGTVTITSGAGIATQVQVTLAVANSFAFVVTPATLTFAYTQGAAPPAAQQIQVTGSQAFTATTTTTDTSTWLSVSPASGSGQATLNVTVDPSGLAAGAHTGTVTVSPAGGAAQTVSVTLTVTALGVTVTPNTLGFFYRLNDALPAAQTLHVSAAGADIAFTASGSSSGWLSITPVSGNTPAALTVSVNPAGLASGSYSGTITVTGGSGAPVTIAVTLSITAPLPRITTVVNSASFTGGYISPGEIVSIFGTDLGPATGQSATPDSAGLYETKLANVQVLFNGSPAPLLYAGSGQINTIVPFELATGAAGLIQVIFGSARSNTLTLPVEGSAPGIFSADGSGSGGGAILDLTDHLVTANNPVKVGDIIQIYATGQGMTKPGCEDGMTVPLAQPYPQPVLHPAVLIGNIPADIWYAGSAPGEVAGVVQVNVVIPPGVPSGAVPVILRIGDNVSQSGLTVAVQ